MGGRLTATVQGMNGDIALGVSLRSVSTPPLPRALQEDEWPALRTAVNEVFRPDGGDLTAQYPLLFDRAHRENLRVIIEAPGGAVIAHAGYVARDALVFRRRLRLACIGAVFTATPHRGRGLASRVFSDLLLRARPAADLLMVSGDRGLYRRQGFNPVPPLSRYRLSAPTGHIASVTVRAAQATDLKTMATLYDAEDVHFVRPPDDWSRLWAAARLVDAPARFWMVERGGKPVAYLATQAAAPRPDGSERPRRILELAGDRQALVDAAPAIADEFLVPSYDDTTRRLCEKQGWFRTARQFPITAQTSTAQAQVIPWYGLNYV